MAHLFKAMVCLSSTKSGYGTSPKRKTTLPKKEDDITKKRRQLYSLLIGQILLVCSLCDIFEWYLVIFVGKFGLANSRGELASGDIE